MTVEDPREQCTQVVIRERVGRVGIEHNALGQSASTSVDARQFRAALARIRRRLGSTLYG
jgi:hypothetical protein